MIDEHVADLQAVLATMVDHEDALNQLSIGSS